MTEDGEQPDEISSNIKDFSQVKVFSGLYSIGIYSGRDKIRKNREDKRKVREEKSCSQEKT